MRLGALTAGLLLIAGLAVAADVDGKWTGSIQAPDGNQMTLGFTFKADGAVLTGTHTGPDGRELAIKDGKIDGSNITFVIVVDFGGNEMKIDYKGVVAPEEIKLTMNMEMMPQPMEIVLKRAQ